jgi:hypothetical protein
MYKPEIPNDIGVAHPDFEMPSLAPDQLLVCSGSTENNVHLSGSPVNDLNSPSLNSSTHFPATSLHISWV